MRVAPIFAWYDIWVGFFWDSKKRWLYFFPIPMVGLIFKFAKSSEEIVREMLAKNDIRNTLIDIVNSEIAEEARDEAMEILDATDDKRREEFILYHQSDQGNLCCLVLDYAKYKLVEEGKMKQGKDHFGNFPKDE